jgi:hypothetical protein
VELVRRSPYSAVVVDLPQDGYDRAAEQLREWLAEGVLVRDGRVPRDYRWDDP